MDAIAVTNEVQHAFQKRWGAKVKADVVLVEAASDGARWVSVESVYSGEKKMEEVCYIDPRGNVRVFETTPDLVRFLAGHHSWERRFFSPAVVGATAFLLTLLAVIGVTFLRIDYQPGVEALKGILVLAAGFYFGKTSKA